MARSHNLGHADVLTTSTSYGQVPTNRQGQLIKARMEQKDACTSMASREVVAVMEAFFARVKNG